MSAAERKLGCGPGMSYAAMLPETLDWLVERLARQDWREAFTALAKIHLDLFHYATKDSWLGA
ncbi:hypothetical protein [Streptomyces sp. NPDC060031]|uniref:hypothetical protein n=1 Tax=Streptomyces sp. NPDC060031 TaxID=3347043 RepID=UPI0036BABF45